MRLREVVGHRIREAREQLELTQAEVGERLEELLGVEWRRQQVSTAETGERAFKVDELLAFAAVLRKPVGWLLVPPSQEVVELSDGVGASLSSRRVQAIESRGRMNVPTWERTHLTVEGRSLFEQASEAAQLLDGIVAASTELRDYLEVFRSQGEHLVRLGTEEIPDEDSSGLTQTKARRTTEGRG